MFSLCNSVLLTQGKATNNVQVCRHIYTKLIVTINLARPFWLQMNSKANPGFIRPKSLSINILYQIPVFEIKVYANTPRIENISFFNKKLAAILKELIVFELLESPASQHLLRFNKRRKEEGLEGNYAYCSIGIRESLRIYIELKQCYGAMSSFFVCFLPD